MDVNNGSLSVTSFCQEQETTEAKPVVSFLVEF